MSQIRLNIVSMWGVKRSAVVEIAASATVAELKEAIKTALSLDARDLKLERSAPGTRFGDDVVDGTLEKNKIADGDKITVVSIDVKYGTNVANAPVAAEKPTDVKTTPATMSDVAPNYRTHEPGANFEAKCPTVTGRSVIVPRGFGVFSWPEETSSLLCPCCKGKVPVENVTRIAVSNTNWSFEGVTAEGETQSQIGVVGHEVFWLVKDPNRSFKKLSLTIRDPQYLSAQPSVPSMQTEEKEENKKEVATFQCASCAKSSIPITELGLTLHDRKYCGDCAEHERKRQRDEEESKKREAEDRKNGWRKDAVALPGMVSKTNQ